jgi:hypothetical protein
MAGGCQKSAGLRIALDLFIPRRLAVSCVRKSNLNNIITPDPRTTDGNLSTGGKIGDEESDMLVSFLPLGEWMPENNPVETRP